MLELCGENGGVGILSVICPVCGRVYSSRGSLSSHKIYFKKRGGCLTAKVVFPGRLEEFERLSDRNMLRLCGGDLQMLTQGSIRALKRRGLVTRERGWGGKRVLSALGRALLQEIENEVSRS